MSRRMGADVWRYHDMVGDTSVGAGSCGIPVRLNCPPRDRPPPPEAQLIRSRPANGAACKDGHWRAKEFVAPRALLGFLQVT